MENSWLPSSGHVPESTLSSPAIRQIEPFSLTGARAKLVAPLNGNCCPVLVLPSVCSRSEIHHLGKALVIRLTTSGTSTAGEEHDSITSRSAAVKVETALSLHRPRSVSPTSLFTTSQMCRQTKVLTIKAAGVPFLSCWLCFPEVRTSHFSLGDPVHSTS